MAYYHDLITEQSWQELQNLAKKIQFVLIGGWAAYLYTKTLKSKDIDILVDYDQLPLLQKDYRLIKNERLKKYEAKKGAVEIDIYLPHFSSLGIPVEELLNKTRPQEGFTLVAPEILLGLKLYTLSQRGRTPKGGKDFLDILALFQNFGFSSETIRKTLQEHRIEHVWENFTRHLEEHQEAPELGLNKHGYSKLKRKILQIP